MLGMTAKGRAKSPASWFPSTPLDSTVVYHAFLQAISWCTLLSLYVIADMKLISLALCATVLGAALTACVVEGYFDYECLREEDA